MFNLKIFALSILVSLMLTGCISNGGKTEYSIEPIKTSDGSILCCKAHVYNTKDYKKLKFKFKKTANGEIEVTLDEEGVSASDPAMVQAENNAKLLEAVTSIIPMVKP